MPWKPDDRPIYPVILTLEDWYLLGPVVDLLRKEVEIRVVDAKLDLSWLDDMPYTVVSCADFEVVSPTMAQIGLGEFFAKRFSGEEARWPFRSFAQQFFPEVYRQTAHRLLFEDEWLRILPREALPKNFGNAHKRN